MFANTTGTAATTSLRSGAGGIDAALVATLERHLEQVNLIFERQLASDLSAVNSLCMHIEQYRGKMLRPTVLLLSGLAASGGASDGSSLTEKHHIIAAVAEMIHMATLVHDDVLDEADVRRKGATVNHLWGNETAVMLGDYLISNAFALCATADDHAINHALGRVTNTLCEGELIQLHHRDDFSIDEATYFEIVRRKTASLIGECARIGARLSGAARETCDAMHRFGTSMGIAFQIQDDLLDLVGDERIVGKTLGRDLDKGKLTLPVIYCLQSAQPRERGEIIELIRAREAQPLRRMLHAGGAVAPPPRPAVGLCAAARGALPFPPARAARDFLAAVADSAVDRAS